MLTACGIETYFELLACDIWLPRLQQCLPLAVLKPSIQVMDGNAFSIVATVLTACGIETKIYFDSETRRDTGCNSAYRLRY